MKVLLQKHIKQSREEVSNEDAAIGVDSAVQHLKKSLKIILMRPDTDHVLTSLLLVLQNEIMNYRSFFAVFDEVVEEAVNEFQSAKGNPSHQASLVYVLENSITQLKSANNPESAKALQRIANAKLKITRKTANYFILEMNRGKPISPSYTARAVLKNRQVTHRAEQARGKALKKANEQRRINNITAVKKRGFSNKETAKHKTEKAKPPKKQENNLIRKLFFFLPDSRSEEPDESPPPAQKQKMKPAENSSDKSQANPKVVPIAL